MYIVTFYSYRGGVERTSALVTVGCELARRGRKVLLVDFDLESPGLTSFPPLGLPEPHPGLVEYVTAYRETGVSPDVTTYLYPVEADELKSEIAQPAASRRIRRDLDAVETSGQLGRLWVMPAGRGDADYWAALADTNWQELYDRQDGFLFFEDTRAQWEQLGPDYVLIDTHAGITPFLGISTRQLPDAVVALCPVREPEWGGTQHFLADVAEETARGQPTPIAIHLVWYDLPADTDLEAFLYPETGYNNLPPAAALAQELATMSKDGLAIHTKLDSRAARQYRRLVDVILEGNPKDRDGAQLVLNRLKQTYEYAAIGGELAAAERRLDAIRDTFWDDPDVLLGVADCLATGRRFWDALFCVDRVLELRPDWPKALYQRAMCYRSLGDSPSAQKDLLALLSRPDLSRADLVRGARELYVVAPEEFDAVRQHLRAQRLRAGAIWLLNLRHLTGGSNSWLPSWMRDLSPLEQVKLLVVVEAEMRPRLNVGRLIRDGRFDEAVQVLTPPRGQDLRNLEMEDLVNLVMARWGREGELPEDVCAAIRDQDAKLAPADRRLPTYGQVMALVLWRLGDKEEAQRQLDEARQEANRLAIEEPEDGQTGFINSYWSYTDVSDNQFCADCDQIRRLIGGAPIRPPFIDRARRT